MINLMQDSVFDELDLQLLNALQIEPRASWTALGRVLGADPVTLARRWERLEGEGLAWVTGYASGQLASSGAIVEIDAMPGKLIELAGVLAQDPEVVTVDITAGSRDLVATVFAPTDAALYRYLLGRLEMLDLVARVHSHPIAKLLTEASQWRLRALDTVQLAALRALEPAGVRPRRPNEIDGPIAVELARNGRATVSEIAKRLSLNPRRVRDSIAVQISSGAIKLRTDVVRSQSGWPVYAWYFLSLPASQTDRIAGQLSRLDGIRTVISVVGRYNIAMAVWTRTLEDVSRLEAMIEKQLPDVRFADRSVVMRTTKLVGNLLDDEGRRCGYVPTVRS